MVSVLALRTNKFGPALKARFERLASAGLPMVVAADERNGPVDTGRFHKVSLTEASVRRLGLPVHPDMGWRCGDYFACLLAEALPQADYIWLIEPDIRIHFERPAEFFAKFEASRHDILASAFAPAPANWHWVPHMSPFGSPVHRTFFAIIRLSRRAILKVQEARRKLPATLPPNRFPNDESFVATVLAKAEYPAAIFSNFGKMLDQTTYRFGNPISGVHFDSLPYDNMIYHPVLHGPDYLRVATDFCRREPSEANIAEMAKGMALEFDAAAARRFEQTARGFLPKPGHAKRPA